MNSAARDAGFIGGGLAKVFAMTYAPPEAARVARCYVVAPAFGEEMNRSRDLLRVFGHTAADRGAATVIPDLRGTGDSPGQFGAFDAAAWCDDLSTPVIEDCRQAVTSALETSTCCPRPDTSR